MDTKREKTGGRKAGVPNKMTASLKNMILGALEEAGGQEYLLQQAHANPSVFLSLVGKILPHEMSAKVDGGISLKIQWNDE